MNSLNLTFLRFIAAVSVVFFHFYKVESINNDFVRNYVANSSIFVSFFFFLSGFVMVIAYYGKIETNKFSALRYYLKRFLKIYPLYIFSLFVIIFFEFFLWKNKINENNFKDLLLYVFGIQSFFNGKQTVFNYPAWSISVEFVFYFFFPLYINKFYKFSLFKQFIILSLIWILSILISLNYKLEMNPFTNFNLFLGGNFLGLLSFKGEKFYFNNENINTLILTTSIIILFFLFSTYNIIIINSQNGLLMPLYFVFFYYLVFTKNKFFNILSYKPLIYLGNISYGIYILQYPYYFINRFLIDKFRFNNVFYFYIIGLIIFSIICYEFIEKPIKKYLYKFLK